MASQDNDPARKRYGDFLEQVRKKIRTIEPKHDRGKMLLKKLNEDAAALEKLIKTSSQGITLIDALNEILPASKQWSFDDSSLEGVEIAEQIRGFSFDKDDLWDKVIGSKMIMNGNESVLSHFEKQGICQSAVAWSKDPVMMMIKEQQPVGISTEPGGKPKNPAYTAFTGASGSGKTSTMLWTVRQLEMERKLPRSCLKFYISCNAPDDKNLLDYVFNYVQKYLDDAVRLRTSSILGFGDLVTQRKTTTLVLVLDEVQSRFDHATYKDLPGQLNKLLQFQKVVLLVGSTALSQDVLRQPTAGGEVLNVRMKPLQENTMPKLLQYHLGKLQPQIKDIVRLVKQLFEETPVLWDLMSNHRCAYFTAVVLTELLGEIPMESLPDGWGVGHSATLVSMVACKYRANNGMKYKTQSDCQALMLESLALVAGQNVIPDNEGVDKNPTEGSLALLSKEVIEVGLVERAILPDEEINNKKDKVKVDGYYEFQMSPALTLICVTSILPWIGGISNAADHFEALVATLMVVMRYAQTNKIFHVRRLAQAVPYSGSDDYLYYHPMIPIDQKCFINGPQAPYSDLIVAGVQLDNELPDTVSPHAKGIIATIKGVEEFPVNHILVQCKLTTKKIANFTPQDELAKMGLVFENGKLTSSPDPARAGFQHDSRRYKQYRSGRWLTNSWLKKNKQDEEISVVFATNRLFTDGTNNESLVHATMIEADRDHPYAWQRLYPIIQLVREETIKHTKETGRQKGDGGEM